MAETRPRNHFIAAPGDTAAGPPNLVVPPFPCAPAELYQALRAVALAQPRTVLQSESPEELHMSFVQRTKFWRFPDDLVAQIVATENGGAALTLSSKARYGVEDFGVNKRRVKRWVAEVKARMAG